MMNNLKKRNNGFTFTEVLAVIVIIAILVTLAVPAVTKYITESRKENIVDNALSSISAVRQDMLMNGYTNKTYTISAINDLLNKKISTSPFKGNNEYVGLDQESVSLEEYTGSKIVATKTVDEVTGKTKFEFKMCLFDKAGRGFNLTEEKEINTSIIKLEGVNSCQSLTAVDTLIKKVGTSGLEEVTHPADNTLQIGTNESLTEYRFRGGKTTVTNNYIYFNCSDINNQTKDTCELYRIIGVFPVDDGTGKIENRIKLIKAEQYGNARWDYQSYQFGSSNWARPATLNTTLNEIYWNTINEKYQALVGNAKYYLGGYKSVEVNTSSMYGYERKIDESDGGNYYYGDNPTNWTGRIALMYASDYGYGANSACSESTTLNAYNTNSCPDNNWLYLGDSDWLLAQHSDNSGGAFVVLFNDGYVSYRNVAGGGSNFEMRPVFYLIPDAEFNNNGDGSEDSPYQLKG